MRLRQVSVQMVGLSMLAAAGCQRQTSVVVQNDTDFTVTGKIFYSDNQNVLEDLIDDTGAELDFNLAPGEPFLFGRDCNDLQAIKVEADLQAVGGLGPSESTKVFRDGTDFGCQDILTFQLTAPNPPLELNISFSN